MIWKDLGDVPTETDFLSFEEWAEVQVPTDIRWFLTHVINGGTAAGVLTVPIKGQGEFEAPDVELVFGIEPGNVLLDPDWMKSLTGCWLLGVDSGNFPIVYVLEGPKRGKVYCITFPTALDTEITFHLLADDIREFAPNREIRLR